MSAIIKGYQMPAAAGRRWGVARGVDNDGASRYWTPSGHPECVLQWLLCEEKCVYSCPLLGVLGVRLNLALCDLRAA